MPEHDIVTQPPKREEAFAEDSDTAHQAQAAILLGMGLRMRGDDIFAGRHARDAKGLARVGQEEDFPIPEVGAVTAVFADAADLRRQVLRRMPRAEVAEVAATPAARAEMAADVYKHPTPENAAVLIAASMQHRDPLVRVAAANAALPMTADASEPVAMLDRLAHSGDELVREIAAMTLAHHDPEHIVVPTERQPNEEEESVREPQGSMLIHGTFARNEPWYQPRGDFHVYMLSNVWRDLYSASDFYRWTGYYTDVARRDAGTALVDWTNARGLAPMRLAGHSHGASVMMVASRRLKIECAVLLSSPVHPGTYDLDFGNVRNVRSIRVQYDLVLMADRSAQRFVDPRYNDLILPIKFNHSATHYPSVWKQYPLAYEIGC